MSAELKPTFDAEPRFDTEASLNAWFCAQGLEHLGKLSLATLAPKVEPALMPQLRSVSARRRLVEVLCTEHLARWLVEAMPSPKMKELLPRLAWQFVAEEQAAAAEARAAVVELLSPPPEPQLRPLHAILSRLRADFPSAIAPRPARLLLPDALQLDPQLPGFRFRESRAEVAPGIFAGFVAPEVRLALSPDAAKTDCTCRAAFCVHALAAIDSVLLWLRQPFTPAFGETVADLLRPAWERALRAIESAVPDAAASAAQVEIAWRLRILESEGIEVVPLVRRRNRRGQLSVGTPLKRKRLLEEFGEKLSPADLRLAALLDDQEWRASRQLLFELADRDDLALDEDPDARLRVERVKVALVAEDRGGVVVLTAGIDGTALPRPLVERIRKGRADEPHFIWDAGTRRLTVLDVSAELMTLLAVLATHGNAFPPESHPALLERLSKLSARLPVAMPRSVMGEAVAPVDLPVLRLEAQPGQAVRVELRVRTLPDSGAFLPGEGVRDVHVRRGEKAIHAVRDFERERAAATALQQLLPLASAEPQELPFTFLFDSPQGALELLRVCGRLASPPQLEWIGQPLRVAGRGGPAALKVVLEKKRDWFGVLGGLSVEGERVELARLLDSARRKERFVQVGAHTYVEIEEVLRERLERLSDHTYTSKHGLELGPAGAESLAALESAGARLETDKSWQALVERIFAAKELKPRVPKTLQATLRDYQLEGFRWLSRLASWGAGGVLADDMGLGKTVQALTVLLDRAKAGPALVVAPTSVAFNWIDEAGKFAPSLRLALYAEARDRGLALERLGPRDVLVVSYGLLTRDVERLSAVKFSTIVFDEAQTLKNATTQRFRAARALQGDFRFALSGTPMENHLGELWALFAIVFPGLLGSWDAFRSRFAAPIERGVDPTAAPALARVLQPFLLRRTKAQVEAQLPPRTEVRVPVVLSPAEWALYEDARLAALSDLETKKSTMREQQRRVEVLAALTRLRLLASHPRLYDAASKLESSKLARFMELVSELRAEGHRALVFSQFTSHLALVREVLDDEGIEYEYLDGSTPQGDRARAVKAFQAGDKPLFLISLKAGGFGLNLTAASSVIHLDPWWNPAVEDQASDRAHRIGQHRAVTVYRLVTRGTIEEQMLALHAHKRALVAGVLEGKDVAGKLTTQELLGLLTQRLDRGPFDEPVDDAPPTRH